MSPRRPLLLLCCVTLLGTPLVAQPGSGGSAAATTSSPPARKTSEGGRRGLPQPAVRSKATPPKVGRGTGGKGTTTPPAPRVTTPASKAADCDAAQTSVKAPPAPLPKTADLLSPSVAPCPPGQPASGKP